MEILCMGGGIVDFNRPGQGLSDLCASGFGATGLDLSYFHPMTSWDGKLVGKKKADEVRASEGWEARLADFSARCRAGDMPIPIAYAPDGMAFSENELSVGAKEFLTLMRRYVTLLPDDCRYLVLSTLPARQLSLSRREAEEAGTAYFLSMAEQFTQGRRDRKVLLMNSVRNNEHHFVRDRRSDGREAARWVDRLNERVGAERFGFCVDIGAGTLTGQDMGDLIESVGHRLEAVRLRETDGVHKGSLLPFISSTQGISPADWLGIFRGLRSVGFDGLLALDGETSFLAVSPFLRPALLQMAEKVAGYIAFQIEMEKALRAYSKRVLFGAGNMCRAYMTCYGKDYPPLYTCDNDRRLWGKDFCGLVVHAPDDLRELPADCAIFICNVYYREIRRQLEAMGLKTPIVDFNDEYLPRFPFGRLDTDFRKEEA